MPGNSSVKATLASKAAGAAAAYAASQVRQGASAAVVAARDALADKMVSTASRIRVTPTAQPAANPSAAAPTAASQPKRSAFVLFFENLWSSFKNIFRTKPAPVVSEPQPKLPPGPKPLDALAVAKAAAKINRGTALANLRALAAALRIVKIDNPQAADVGKLFELMSAYVACCDTYLNELRFEQDKQTLRRGVRDLKQDFAKSFSAYQATKRPLSTDQRKFISDWLTENTERMPHIVAPEDEVVVVRHGWFKRHSTPVILGGEQGVGFQVLEWTRGLLAVDVVAQPFGVAEDSAATPKEQEQPPQSAAVPLTETVANALPSVRHVAKGVGAGAVAATAAGGVASVVGAPIVVTAAAVGGAGAAIYWGWRWFSKKPTTASTNP